MKEYLPGVGFSQKEDYDRDSGGLRLHAPGYDRQALVCFRTSLQHDNTQSTDVQVIGSGFSEELVSESEWISAAVVKSMCIFHLYDTVDVVDMAWGGVKVY